MKNEVKEKLIKHFGNDPFYNDLINSTTPTASLKAREALISARGMQAYNTLIKTYTRLIKESLNDKIN